MNGSWRTTTVGVAQLAVAVLTAIVTLVTGQQMTPEQAQAIADAGQAVDVNFAPSLVTSIGITVYVILQAIGMKNARDDKVSSEQAGAKR